MNPAISIIVPVYNVEAYLRQCVDSILAQTFTDFEVILVDDGSPDNCGAICDDYAIKDDRIRVIHQINSGLSAARNTGIDNACGEYLCFVDSDDVLAPMYCECLYRVAVDGNVNMAACKMERFIDEPICFEQSEIHLTELMSFPVFLKKQMGKEIEMGVCNRLFHRSIFERIRYMPGLLHEDIILAGDLLLIDFGNVAYVDSPLYFYRQRANSIVNQQAQSSKCHPDRIFAAEYLIKCAHKVEYEYMDESLAYAAKYPWYFIDPIYVHFSFRENKRFLNELQNLLRKNINEYRSLKLLDGIQRKRMTLFARSKILYGFNAYARLLRVYIYHVLKKDAYADGHGI